MAADTNIQNLSSVSKKGSLYNIAAQNVTKATDAFGNMMKQSIKTASNAVNTVKGQDTPGIQEKMSNRRSQVEYIVRGARHTGDGTAVDESVMTSDLKALTSDIRAVVCAVLDVTDEELEKMLAESGMCITDLLNQSNLADFVADNLADGDSMKLLTDSSVSQAYSELGNGIKNLISNASDELGVSAEELTDMLKDFVTVQNNADVDEKTSQVSNASAVNMQDGMLNETVMENTVQNTVNNRQTTADAGMEQKTESEDNAQNVNQPTTGTLEEKITLTSDNNTGSQMTGNGSESLSGQFLETLISNVDNSINAESAFEGYNVSPEEIVRQIIDAVKVNVNSTSTEMELQLHPESLGKVNLVVAAKDGIITAQIAAQDEAVKNVIENQLVMLKESFEQQGLKVEAVEVTVQSHGFETGKNLEGRDDNAGSENDGSHRQTRRLTLDEINALIGDDELTDDENLAVEMMRATGRSIDYMA
jgi:flagellar hook-length control protein FliK